MTTPIEQERAWMAASGTCRPCGHLLVFHKADDYCLVRDCLCEAEGSSACEQGAHAGCPGQGVMGPCACRCHVAPEVLLPPGDTRTMTIRFEAFEVHGAFTVGRYVCMQCTRAATTLSQIPHEPGCPALSGGGQP